MFVENIVHIQKHKVRSWQRKKTWGEIWKCIDFGAFLSLVPCFFSTCALFDIRTREHALGFLGFTMEVIGVFVFSFLSLSRCHQSFFRRRRSNAWKRRHLKVGASTKLEVARLKVIQRVKRCINRKNVDVDPWQLQQCYKVLSKLGEVFLLQLATKVCSHFD